MRKKLRTVLELNWLFNSYLDDLPIFRLILSLMCAAGVYSGFILFLSSKLLLKIIGILILIEISLLITGRIIYIEKLFENGKEK